MITWHEMRQFQQPRHFKNTLFGNELLVSNCQNLPKVGHDIVIFNGNVLGRVMRDIPDARNLPMERG